MPDAFSQMCEFVEFAKTATRQDALQRQFQKHIGQHGFHMHTCLSTVDLSNRPQNSIFWIDHFNASWAERYVEQKYERSDPVLLRSTNASTPFFWADEFDFTKFTKRQKTIFDEASQVDIVNGFTVPLLALGMPPTTVNVIGGKEVEAEQPTLNAMHLMAIFFHAAALRIEHAQPHFRQVRLTKRERECLQWVFAGKSSSVIAELLNVSQSTVNFHLANATKKFGVATRHQAATNAFLSGQISF